MSFLQKLKKNVQRITLAKYEDLLSPPDFEVGNQQEVYDFAQEAVHKSLKEGLFLQGGEDENVSFFFFDFWLFISYISCYIWRADAKTLHIQQYLLWFMSFSTPMMIVLQLSFPMILKTLSLIMPLL